MEKKERVLEVGARNQDPTSLFSRNSHRKRNLDVGFADRATWNED